MSRSTHEDAQHWIWNELVGHAWVRHADVHERQAAPFGDAAINALEPIAGATVLDVGCGTGATSEELLRRGASRVLGVDLSKPMIDAAEARYTRSGLSFHAGDVLGFDERDQFDVVFSRFGVMFFAEPVAAFARLRALGTAGARLGFSCWGPPPANPWMSVPVMATMPIIGPLQLAGPGEPGPFSLSSADVVRSVLDSAGWTEVSIDTLTIDQAHPAGDAASVADVMVEFSPPIADGLRRLPERADEAVAAIAQSLRPFERGGVVHLQSSALIVTARA